MTDDGPGVTDELLPGQVYRLDLGRSNAYLVDDGEVTLVDAGTPGALDRLRGGLATAGYRPADLDRVLVTHADLDHVGGLAGLTTDALPYAMEPDASYLDGSAAPPLTNHKGVLQRLMGWWLDRPDGPVRRLEDGETVGGFEAVHTPGHSPGHAVYLHEDLSLGLLGDLVRERDGRLVPPPWFINYRSAENAASVRTLVERGASFDVAAMGHGDPLVEEGAVALRELARRLG